MNIISQLGTCEIRTSHAFFGMVKQPWYKPNWRSSCPIWVAFMTYRVIDFSWQLYSEAPLPKVLHGPYDWRTWNRAGTHLHPNPCTGNACFRRLISQWRQHQIASLEKHQGESNAARCLLLVCQCTYRLESPCQLNAPCAHRNWSEIDSSVCYLSANGFWKRYWWCALPHIHNAAANKTSTMTCTGTLSNSSCVNFSMSRSVVQGTTIITE